MQVSFKTCLSTNSTDEMNINKINSLLEFPYLVAKYLISFLSKGSIHFSYRKIAVFPSSDKSKIITIQILVNYLHGNNDKLLQKLVRSFSENNIQNISLHASLILILVNKLFLFIIYSFKNIYITLNYTFNSHISL